MKVKCINQGNFKNVTLGNEYEVSDQTESLYYVVNNIGDTAKYSKNYFEIIQEIEEVVVPVVAKKELSIKLRDNRYDEEDYDNIYIKCHVNSRYATTFSLLNYISGNCGVISINGITDLINSLINLKNNDLFDESIEDVFKTIINQLLKILNEDSWGLVIFSTNTNNDILVALMDELADSSTSVFKNPNSGNNCKMWHFFINQ